jgi:hypothetical protein
MNKATLKSKSPKQYEQFGLLIVPMSNRSSQSSIEEFESQISSEEES